MHQPAPARAEVRQQLDAVLRTDADHDAFCLDNFPDVHKRFARRMERTDKVNLLLSVEELAHIAARLRERTSRWGAGERQPGWRWTAVAVALLALAAGGFYATLHRSDKRSSATVPAIAVSATGQPSGGTRAAPALTGINSGNLIIDSAGAQLRNRASSALRDLGAAVNSGNRIEGSPGPVISNEVGGP